MHEKVVVQGQALSKHSVNTSCGYYCFLNLPTLGSDITQSADLEPWASNCVDASWKWLLGLCFPFHSTSGPPWPPLFTIWADPYVRPPKNLPSTSSPHPLCEIITIYLLWNCFYPIFFQLQKLQWLLMTQQITSQSCWLVSLLLFLVSKNNVWGTTCLFSSAQMLSAELTDFLHVHTPE